MGIKRQSTIQSLRPYNIPASVNVIAQQKPAAVDLVHLFSIMNPNGISVEFLVAAAEGFRQSKLPYVKELVKWVRKDKLLMIHRLVRLAVKSRMTGRNSTPS